MEKKIVKLRDQEVNEPIAKFYKENKMRISDLIIINTSMYYRLPYII